MKLPRYPVYVISKGRSDRCLTANFLLRDRMPFHLVVEPQEADAYAAKYGRERLLVTPFSNLQQGSIPARNFVWQHALDSGAERHWILDDNIRGMLRRFKARRLHCNSGIGFACTEDFIDRYENIAIGGLAYEMFVPDRRTFQPFLLNVHVYSCLLIRNDLPQRWRGRYNEDTDLCLQVLSAGWCTVLVQAFVVSKMATMTMRGGNSDQLYRGDGRVAMARSLERAWPYVVRTDRRFRRPQHKVRDEWRKFDTPLVRRADLDWDALPPVDEYGMQLVQVGEQVRSPELARLIAAHRAERER